jgi:hypothetical protein
LGLWREADLICGLSTNGALQDIVSTGSAIDREQVLDLHDGEFNVVYGSLARWPWRENSNSNVAAAAAVYRKSDFLEASGDGQWKMA